MINWFITLFRRSRCEHEWKDDGLVDLGRRKLFTCVKCGKSSIF